MLLMSGFHHVGATGDGQTTAGVLFHQQIGHFLCCDVAHHLEDLVHHNGRQTDGGLVHEHHLGKVLRASPMVSICCSKTILIGAGYVDEVAFIKSTLSICNRSHGLGSVRRDAKVSTGRVLRPAVMSTVSDYCRSKFPVATDACPHADRHRWLTDRSESAFEALERGRKVDPVIPHVPRPVGLLPATPVPQVVCHREQDIALLAR